MNEDTKRDLLAKEYLHLQSTIEQFDARALSIKTWSVTASLAGLGAAFAGKSEIIFLVSSVSSLLFWILEASWKTFQVAYYSRNDELENYFAGKGDAVPFQIAKSWYGSWRAGGRLQFFRIMCWGHVFTPHLFIILAGVTLFILSEHGIVHVNAEQGAAANP